MDYTDISCNLAERVLTITIDREQRLNAFRGRTIEELLHAFRAAWINDGVSAVVLTGAGSKAFCVGGDQKEFAETGSYGVSANGRWEIEDLHLVIRQIPKPVIAAVNGFAIGGGNVLAAVCDVAIAASHAKFGQVGPRVGSFDAGWGTHLTRLIGERRAREMWFFCRQYSAEEVERWGLVNKVVPGESLMAEAQQWGRDAAALSPTALKFLKCGFNMEGGGTAAQALFADAGLQLYLQSEECKEGRVAFAEKRQPDFASKL
uniref:Naphthoate synthase n=1 Tax=Sphingomonas sp. JE1 TaxID=1628059 RepID=A0A0D4ZZC2_9SPHN|nr:MULTISPECIES: enoyl-CoA hydratase-related protein [unclassified Sphingomonas]AJW29597.1 Naphthoate synthase [Sphingomonas sp. JE1]